MLPRPMVTMCRIEHEAEGFHPQSGPRPKAEVPSGGEKLMPNALSNLATGHLMGPPVYS